MRVDFMTADYFFDDIDAAHGRENIDVSIRELMMIHYR